MYNKLYFLIAFLLFCTQFSFSQVTIGGIEKPVHGALLQLKNIEGVDDGSPNSTKGLLLPRVNLMADGKIENSNYTLNLSTKGLVIYNVQETDDYCKGLHVWNGSGWDQLGEQNISNGSFNSTTGILTDVEGNIYNTASFGDAGIWMTQNLRTTKYIKCGELRDFSINDAGEDSDFERQMGYPNTFGMSIKNNSFYNLNSHLGILYNWCAATNRVNATIDESTDNIGVQGICPDGWHIPSINEYNALIDEINKNTSVYANMANINTTPSSSGTYGGLAVALYASNQPGIGDNVYNGKSNLPTQNGVSFYALGYGMDGVVKSSGGKDLIYVNSWTSSNKNATDAYYLTAALSNTNDFVDTKKEWNKKALFPIRCKKD